VFTVRDGALTRLDRQSPPGRLLIPRPPTGPIATAIAVGATRAWVARGSVILGYSTDPASPTPVWSVRVPAVAGPAMLASSAGWLWVGDPVIDVIVPIDVVEHAVRRPSRHVRAPIVGTPVAVSGHLVGLAAVSDGLWAVTRTPTGWSDITTVVARRSGDRPQLVARIPRSPIAVAAAGWSIAVLVRGQVLRFDARSHRLVQRIEVPISAAAISATVRDVVVSDPDTGTIIDIPWRSPRARILVRVERPGRWPPRRSISCLRRAGARVLAARHGRGLRRVG